LNGGRAVSRQSLAQDYFVVIRILNCGNGKNKDGLGYLSLGLIG
jgi:hypothetical protein